YGATGISDKLVSLLSLLAANALQMPTHLHPGPHLLRRLTRGYQDCTPPGCCIRYCHLDFCVLKKVISTDDGFILDLGRTHVKDIFWFNS
ncbi:MAG: hypothetical protein WDZ72_07815, partial [Cyclobacteriaceae bacterium]